MSPHFFEVPVHDWSSEIERFSLRHIRAAVRAAVTPDGIDALCAQLMNEAARVAERLAAALVAQERLGVPQVSAEVYRDLVLGPEGRLADAAGWVDGEWWGDGESDGRTVHERIEGHVHAALRRRVREALAATLPVLPVATLERLVLDGELAESVGETLNVLGTRHDAPPYDAAVATEVVRRGVARALGGVGSEGSHLWTCLTALPEPYFPLPADLLEVILARVERESAAEPHGTLPMEATLAIEYVLSREGLTSESLDRLAALVVRSPWPETVAMAATQEAAGPALWRRLAATGPTPAHVAAVGAAARAWDDAVAGAALRRLAGADWVAAAAESDDDTALDALEMLVRGAPGTAAGRLFLTLASLSPFDAAVTLFSLPAERVAAIPDAAWPMIASDRDAVEYLLEDAEDPEEAILALTEPDDGVTVARPRLLAALAAAGRSWPTVDGEWDDDEGDDEGEDDESDGEGWRQG